MGSFRLCSTSQPSRPEHLTVGVYRLDFPYPQGTTYTLGALSPSFHDRCDRKSLCHRGNGPRHFTSATYSTRQSRRPSDEAGASFAADSTLLDEPVSTREKGAHDNPEEHSEDTHDIGKTPNLKDGTMLSNESSEEVAEDRRKERQKILQNILENGLEHDFDEVWKLYHIVAKKKEDRAAWRDKFLAWARCYRTLSHLLGMAIKTLKWETIGDIWELFHGEYGGSRCAISVGQIASTVSMEELGKGLKGLYFQILHSNKTVVREDPNFSKSLVDYVIYPCIYRYVLLLDPNDSMVMVKLLKDYLLYEKFIRLVQSKDIAIELYKEYRKLPDVKIRGHIMRRMVSLYYPANDPAGMEMVQEDWYRRFKRFDIGNYRLYMNFYARRGNVIAVKRLWKEYTTEYPDRKSPIGTQKPEYLPLLHVHAVKGELGEVRRAFSALKDVYGEHLSVICWNILLNAHAKAGEYDAAVRVFCALQEVTKPDEYSFGTIMGLSGSRGDLEFTLELYRMAKDQGIQPNAAMVDCVVEAYCQNQSYSDAESICTTTTKAGRFCPEECTVLWNTLLYHSASQHDLVNMNRLLTLMTEHNIPYNNETYDYLLRGLALCRQPHHALYLLKTAVEKRSFKPTLRNYALLMSAFLHTRQTLEALKTSNILQGLQVPKSGDIMIRVFRALGNWATSQSVDGSGKSRNLVLSALRQFRKSIEAEQMDKKAFLPESTWLQPVVPPITVSARTDQAAVLMFIFTQIRQTAQVQVVLDLWRSSSTETSNMQEPPLRLLEAMMLAAYYDGKYDEVKQLWKIVFDQAYKMSRVAAPGTTRTGPLPSMRYTLSNSLKTMQRMYKTLGDAEGLKDTIASVLQAGFRLDSKNWNYHVQFLVSMKKFREAFVVCEEQLSPRWTGWMRLRKLTPGAQVRIPLNLRRVGGIAQHTRPTSYTLMILSKAYMDLEQMAAWSPEAESLLSYIVEKCPVVISAVRTMLRTGTTLEKTIFLGETRAKLEEEMQSQRRKSVQLKNAPEGDLPQSFLDMIKMAEDGQGTSTSVQQDWWLDDDNAAVSDARSDDDNRTPRPLPQNTEQAPSDMTTSATSLAKKDPKAEPKAEPTSPRPEV